MTHVDGLAAVSDTWPSIVYLKWRYSGMLTLWNGTNITQNLRRNCVGSLIDRQTVLAAANCIPSGIVRFILSSENKFFHGQIHLNEKYPTYASMLTVYLGLQDRKLFLNDSYRHSMPTIVLNASKIIKVPRIKLNLNLCEIKTLNFQKNN